MKTYHKFSIPGQSTRIGMQYISSALLFIFLAGINLPVSAQEEKSTTILITPASQADKSELSESSASKFTRMQQSETYGLVMLVKVGNLAKIQKNGVLTFDMPGSGESATYKAKKVVAYSETDFTWSGASADGEALFLCKKGRLTGNFSVRGRSFQLSSIAGEAEFSILSENRADLEIRCDVENP